ncbi:MarR family transcriptional regulator [Aestuariimicrobium ganziense]|uniref:MarR family transcriptional regulator n=1 Tax=Aestuariimicrobium ganziense TaxID=2773677 RepID=UPI001A9B03A9|nr:MarR family transcriptional regulator [Aestuariimicrobium ganziense]
MGISELPHLHQPTVPNGPRRRPEWTFLTNHGHVLLAVAAAPDARLSDIAAQVGITTRATLAILHDLEAANYVARTRIGRRTHYTVNYHGHFRHPATATHEIGELMAIFTDR